MKMVVMRQLMSTIGTNTKCIIATVDVRLRYVKGVVVHAAVHSIWILPQTT